MSSSLFGLYFNNVEIGIGSEYQTNLKAQALSTSGSSTIDRNQTWHNSSTPGGTRG